MSKPDHAAFAALLEAHTCRVLTADEERQLRALAAADPQRVAELRTVDALHEVLADERELRAAVALPATPVEEADEGYRRLQSIAARAEDELRAKLTFGAAAEVFAGLRAPPDSAAVRGVRAGIRRGWFFAAAAGLLAAAGLGLALLGRGDGRPELLEGRPDGRTLGQAARIVLRAELDPARPVLSWHPVLGASRYDARIEDGDGALCLERTVGSAASTTWEFTEDQIRTLRAVRAAGRELFLRLVATDRAGIPIASTGDLPLRLGD
jgi:hypothetical protein